MKKPIRQTQGRHFYSHLIEIDSIVIELDQIVLEQQERDHLISIIDSSMYHLILDSILSELAEDDKKLFLTNLHENDHGKIWDFLNKKIKNIEDKIKKTSIELKDQLKNDIKEIKDKGASSSFKK